MQFTSTISVALLAVSTTTVTATQTSSNLRGGRVSHPTMGTAETAVPSSLYSIPDAVITATPSSSGVSQPAMGTAETAAPSSLGVALPAMGTAETAAPSSLGVALPAMGTAETALFPNHDRSLIDGCPGNDQPAHSSFCICGGDKQYTCCAHEDTPTHTTFYCSKTP